MVSLMRLILATSALLIIYIDPSEPDRLVAITYSALALYALFSLSLCVLAVRRPHSERVARIHWVDLAWYVVLITLSSGTNSIFFFFFFFAIIVASFRFGFGEGLGITLASVTLFTLVASYTASAGSAFELNRFLMRPVCLLVLGYMIAYWGGTEINFRRRLAFLKEVNRLSNPRFGVDQTVCSIMERLRVFYGADECILLLPAPNSSDYFVRRAERSQPDKALRAERVPAAAVRPLVALAPDRVIIFNMARRWWPPAPRYRVRTTNGKEQGGGRCADDARAAEAIADMLGGSYVSIPLQTRDMAAGRFYLVCQGVRLGGSDVDFLRQVAEQVQPVVENIQLLDNLASEAAEQERHRLARDIHDSTIQSYVGFKLALETMRRRVPEDGALGRELDGLIGVVNEGIDDLRRYIQGLRTTGRGAGEVLIPAIRRQAEKFTAFYGIKVGVRVCEEIHVNDRLAAEVFQLVREGLSNVRRHTRARSATVSLECTDTLLHVQIENDDAQENWRPEPFVPRSISERAAGIGGRVLVNVGDDGRTTVLVEIPT